ncbi:hypothetical protein GCM10023212_31960 [Luteolibacter yonseiensis]
MGLTAVTNAGTVAYWRFEDGPLGQVAAGNNGEEAYNNTITDSSGNGNHLRTYATFTSPSYIAAVPGSTVPGTGASNAFSLDFAPNRDIYTGAGSSLPAASFTNFTIEAYVSFDSLGSWQTFIGRDDSGSPGQGAGPESLFYFQAMGDGSNKLRVQAMDSLNTIHNVSSISALSVNTWYHVAAVSNGTTMELYLDGVLQGSTSFTGGLYDPAQDTIWTIGRGQYGGNNGDFLDGKIDEVRFSDSALDSSLFLNVPEPGCFMLAVLGACVSFKRRR